MGELGRRDFLKRALVTGGGLGALCRTEEALFEKTAELLADQEHLAEVGAKCALYASKHHSETNLDDLLDLMDPNAIDGRRAA